MKWETPTLTEVDMSAEIGAYQGETEPNPWPPVAEAELPAADDCEA